FLEDLNKMDDEEKQSLNLNLSRKPKLAHQRNIRSVIGRLLVAAASYCIWIERNCRTFKNVRYTPEEVRDNIITIVRLKLLTCRFKNTTMVNELLARWKMQRNFRLYG
ncbi:hypothetical protein Tco_1162457, partial [Tanacetum coccineum]